MSVQRASIPVVLTIAGSDSGGGAGIQADLKVFSALGVHGTCAITCITAQNPRRITAIEPVSPKLLRAQLEAIFSGFRVRAAKTGMLYSAELIEVVVDCFRGKKAPPLVVDPVMIATSGSRLLKPDAAELLKTELFPLAMLVTPNVPEAEALLGTKIRSLSDARRAACEFVNRFGCPVLLKGGHLADKNFAIDIFNDGTTEFLFRARRIHGIRPHGAGCTYSAAITAHLAIGSKVPEIIKRARRYTTKFLLSELLGFGH